MLPLVTAIIPTLCERSRAALLRRAIQSLLNATTRPLTILVVANGGKIDQSLASSLLNYRGVQVIYCDTPSAPLAALAGRQLVQSKYFCFLDDDDEYLPEAIDHRVDVLREHPEWDFVVSDGYRCCAGREETILKGLDLVQLDPLKALLRANWLASCGALFKTDSIGVEFFLDPHPYMEWTWVAFRLVSAGKRFGVIETPDFKVHNTPRSVSKSERYIECEVSLIQKMLALNSRLDLVSELNRRICQAWHDASELQLNKSQLSRALVSHIRSLKHAYGWRFLPYTRKIFYEALFSLKDSLLRRQ